MSEAVATHAVGGSGIDWRNLIWVALALAVLIVTIAAGNRWALNFLHVMCGVLWTGIDLFMGFGVGPIIRTLPFEARRAIVVRLLPKTLFLMPTLCRRHRHGQLVSTPNSWATSICRGRNMAGCWRRW